jgi:hypothetical protein
MTECGSSFIQSYGFNAETLELDIRWHDGVHRRYKGVTQKRFDAFVKAESKGRHFSSSIMGKYEWVPVLAEEGETE